MSASPSDLILDNQLVIAKAPFAPMHRTTWQVGVTIMRAMCDQAFPVIPDRNIERPGPSAHPKT
ncbi:hypothetical protein ASS64_03510 [Erythrobacter sp. AP23]|nr:hypothetical protein ASS64_03510 [Erythrobacter sp. AP23]